MNLFAICCPKAWVSELGLGTLHIVGLGRQHKKYIYIYFRYLVIAFSVFSNLDSFNADETHSGDMYWQRPQNTVLTTDNY